MIFTIVNIDSFENLKNDKFLLSVTISNKYYLFIYVKCPTEIIWIVGPTKYIFTKLITKVIRVCHMQYVYKYNILAETPSVHC